MLSLDSCSLFPSSYGKLVRIFHSNLMSPCWSIFSNVQGNWSNLWQISSNSCKGQWILSTQWGFLGLANPTWNWFSIGAPWPLLQLKRFSQIFKILDPPFDFIFPEASWIPELYFFPLLQFWIVWSWIEVNCFLAFRKTIFVCQCFDCGV